MKKVLFVSKHIHSCFASWSSGDVTLYKRVKRIEDAKELITETYGDKFITVAVAEPDKTFYDRGLATRPMSYATKEEMTSKCTPYIKEGWTNVRPKEIKSYWNREKIKRQKANRRAGFIFWKEDTRVKPILYRGGFSSTVYNNKHFIEYTKKRTFGYIGHCVRKVMLDKALEKSFMSLTPPTTIPKDIMVDLFVCWLTSTDGRHFGDSLEDLKLSEQKKKISNRIKSIYNLAYVFSLPEHKGTYSSTQLLTELHKDKLFKEV